MHLSIATWNVNSLRVRLPQVLDWLGRARPDVLALQEIKQATERVDRAAIEAAGYHLVANGQPTYNGVALLSRTAPQEVAREPGEAVDPQRRIIAATYGDVRVVNVYAPNGQAPGSDKYRYKLEWYARLAGYLSGELDRHRRLVVVGDFNVAPGDDDVHAPELWRDGILVSEPERAALREVTDLGLTDLYRHCVPGGRDFTWWDYRARSFARDAGLRIDLILASAPLTAGCREVRVDRAQRAVEQPSDHAPVIAEFEL